MDPTMQSPVRLSLPEPEPIDLEVPSGPYFYPVKAWVGSLAQGNSPRQAFDALLQHATPFQRETGTDGGVVSIPFVGPVQQRVDTDRLTVVNTALPSHLLYPGNVHRSIVQEGDDLYVVTHGYGTGILTSQNESLGNAVWRPADHNIRHALNPYKPFGYPMDEMNAVTGVVPPSANPAAENDKPSGLIGNEPMDFSVNRLPIFFRY
jgi:hypothetical protein